jgi:hypothetical protein
MSLRTVIIILLLAAASLASAFAIMAGGRPQPQDFFPQLTWAASTEPALPMADSQFNSQSITRYKKYE